MKLRLFIIIGFLLTSASFLHARKVISDKILDNGLHVVVVENHTVPLATIAVVFKYGSFVENAENNGLAHLLTHMLFQSQRNIPILPARLRQSNRLYPTQEAYLNRLQELGALTAGGAREEWVYFVGTLAADSLESGLEYVSESVQYPMFTDEVLQYGKQSVLSELEEIMANPKYELDKGISNHLWGKYYFSRKNYFGKREVVDTATIEQIRLAQEQYIVPNNAALLIAGDVKPRQVFKIARDMFSDWQAGADPANISSIPPVPPLMANQDTIVTQPVNNVELLLAWQGPGVNDDVKGTFAADVFSFIMGQQTSEFQRNLVGSGLALHAEVFYYTQKWNGPIYIRLMCRPQKFWDLYRAVNAEIQHFTTTDYFTDKQLENAKTMLEVNAVYQRDEASKEIHSVGFWWAVTGLEYYRSYLDNLRAVSREDIDNYVNRYILDRPHVTGALMSREVKRQLNAGEGSLLP
ncbi:M16 family metallopeptidase [Candidatus Neomarinimicrobiota bacterium]